jgi:hypothetical protein
MFEIQFDPAKNLLRIAFAGCVTADEAKLSSERLAQMIDSVPEGFRLLTDLSGLKSMELQSAPFVEETMKLCAKHGVSSIVRVIPDPQADIGLSIMSVFHYSRRTPITTCQTLTEAMAILENR